MTIDEAIQILRLNEADLAYETQKDRARAKKLGIEALKHYQRERDIRGATKTMWLPGETKE